MLPSPVQASRTVALRPISAGDAGARSGGKPEVDAEALREDELRRLYGPDLDKEYSREGTRSGSAARSEDDDEEPAAVEIPVVGAGDAAFLAQLLAQDEPAEEPVDPYRDASRAYGRFREERHVGLVIDIRDPVDVMA
jgi:hypothetical protein